MIVAQEVDQNSPTCQRRMCRVRVGTRDAADSLSSTALPSGAASASERITHACWTLKCCLPRTISPTSQSSDSTSPDLSKPTLPRRPPSFKCHGRRVEVCAWSVKCMQPETRACWGQRVAASADCKGPNFWTAGVLVVLQRLLSVRLF